MLRQVDHSKPSSRRLSIAEYIKRFERKWIDLLILDELHELKGGDTAQGNAFGMISSKARKCVGLTGTLLNGYASSLFYILFRLQPKMMREELKLEYKDVRRFVKVYGAEKTTFSGGEVDKEGKMTRMGKKNTPSELPSINPHLLTLLLPFTIFLKLDEMNIALPDYEEEVILLEPNKEWEEPYKSYLGGLAREVRTNKRVLGALANDAISICDLPFLEAYSPFSNEIYRPAVDESFITNKEYALVDKVREEIEQGRKCLIYTTYSNKGTNDRVKHILETELGITDCRIGILGANVDAKKRADWINGQKLDILICNPELVKTGLDLLEYPTIIFYQTTYNVFTLKQASRRSWRIGQTNKVKVVFMAYSNTGQSKALSLISKKIASANSLEGRLSIGSDLASFEEDSTSLQVQLAREIANGMKDDDEISTTSWKFIARDWDKYEAAYMNIKELANTKVVVEKEKEAVVEAVKLSEIVEEVIETISQNKEEEVIAKAESNLFDYLEKQVDSSTNKIKLTRVEVVKGKRKTYEVEATLADIQLMVQDTEEATKGAYFQASLF